MYISLAVCASAETIRYVPGYKMRPPLYAAASGYYLSVLRYGLKNISLRHHRRIKIDYSASAAASSAGASSV